MSTQFPQHRPARPRPQAGRVIRERAQWALRAHNPPTVPIGIGAWANELDERQARAVIDLALRTGESMLSTGASASDVVATVLRLMSAYGVRSAHVDITYTSITVSMHRGIDDDPLTVMRIVRVRSADYTRLERLQELVRAIAEDKITVDEARARLDQVVRAPHPYRRWFITATFALMAAAVTALLGGGIVMIIVSTLTTVLIDQSQRWLAQRGLAAFFSQAVGGAIPTLVAVGLYAAQHAGLHVLGGISPSLVVASGIIVLLAGLSVVGSAQDALDGYYVTAGARTFEVMLMTLGVVAGVTGVLALAGRLGVPMSISPFTSLAPSIAVQVLASMATATFFCLSTYTGARATIMGTVTAGLGWCVYLLGFELGFGRPTASALAALVIGAVAQLVGYRLRVPSLVITTAGIVPLLPGGSVYRGLFEMLQGANGDATAALPGLVEAAAVGLALAGGVSLGTFVGRPARLALDRSMRRALGRGRADARE
ncbi:MAG TPA: threonine/serine exporter family protein [Segeticoccus sp.]|uniref:threonine/serine ThrE exporter family protein n=1 Tax=Segeticoccus sp. TaxID=2706531 RepID=UPI002D7EE9A7|nr:threonine/serine exporter family protein [Segeticoccus sp.]HET8599920.1 threonine/serine exporter family protein [Segeticoccus sp.]